MGWRKLTPPLQRSRTRRTKNETTSLKEYDVFQDEKGALLKAGLLFLIVWSFTEGARAGRDRTQGSHPQHAV